MPDVENILSDGIDVPGCDKYFLSRPAKFGNSIYLKTKFERIDVLHFCLFKYFDTLLSDSISLSWNAVKKSKIV